MFAVFGLGPVEILVVLVIGFACFGIPLGVGMILYFALRKSGGNPSNLVPCPDCGRSVSRGAATCPGCGRPMS